MHYQADISGAIGEALIPEREFHAALAKAEHAVAAISKDISKGTYGHHRLALTSDDLDGIERVVSEMCENWNDVVILGTGGSSLGAQALIGLTHPSLPKSEKSTNLYFLDNLDGDQMDAALQRIDLRKCGFLAVSKSGSTAETIAQVFAAMARIKDLGAEKYMDQHFAVITEAGDNPLRRLAINRDFRIIDHPADLGGRFSVLSCVGLIPAAIGGLDIRALRAGAKATIEQFLGSDDIAANPAASGGALAAAALQAGGKNINAMFAYGERLRDFGQWFLQLWSESIGKEGIGSTPVFAAGPVDQHSQLQLYADGPKDKLFTMITYPTGGEGPLLSSTEIDDERLQYLGDHYVGDVVAAEAMATAATLKASGHPLRHIRLAELDEEHLGALLMHFMLETEVAAHILGVNAYVQPGVEAGKVQMKGILSS